MTPSTEERFKAAVQAGDVAELRQLAGRRGELRGVINAPVFAFDSPALVAAAGRGNVDLVDALLALGADPNRRSEWWAGGFHPLYSASGAVADRLLEAGAIPDACAAAQLDRVDLLLEMLANDPARVHERGGDGQTPLHFARSRRAADLLLETGAEIDARDLDHRSTPAEWMLGDADDAVRSRVALARYLVERGATADIFLAASLGLTRNVRELLERDPSLLALRTGHGRYGEQPPSSYHIYFWTIGAGLTPLQAAARFGQSAAVDVMLPFASPTQRLLLSCHRGDAAEAHRIVRDHPGIVERLTGDDRASLTAEAWRANARAVTLMMELGFDPGVPSRGGGAGGTALHCAAWEGSAESVAAILEYPNGRALIERRDPHFGGTPFGWCCHGSLNCRNERGDYAAVARLLIDAGAVVDPEKIAASDAVLKVIAGRGAR